MDTEIDHNLEQITREYVDFLDDTVRVPMNQVCVCCQELVIVNCNVLSICYVYLGAHVITCIFINANIFNIFNPILMYSESLEFTLCVICICSFIKYREY